MLRWLVRQLHHRVLGGLAARWLLDLTLEGGQQAPETIMGLDGWLAGVNTAIGSSSSADMQGPALQLLSELYKGSSSGQQQMFGHQPGMLEALIAAVHRTEDQDCKIFAMYLLQQMTYNEPELQLRLAQSRTALWCLLAAMDTSNQLQMGLAAALLYRVLTSANLHGRLVAVAISDIPSLLRMLTSNSQATQQQALATLRGVANTTRSLLQKAGRTSAAGDDTFERANMPVAEVRLQGQLMKPGGKSAKQHPCKGASSHSHKWHHMLSWAHVHAEHLSVGTMPVFV
jgi:hypothetical protein